MICEQRLADDIACISTDAGHPTVKPDAPRMPTTLPEALLRIDRDERCIEQMRMYLAREQHHHLHQARQYEERDGWENIPVSIRDANQRAAYFHTARAADIGMLIHGSYEQWRALRVGG